MAVWLSNTKAGSDEDTLVQLVARHAAHIPEKTAFTFLGETGAEERNVTFSELHSDAMAIAARIGQLDVFQRPVMLLFPTGEDFVRAFLGCLYAGAIPVPVPLPSGESHDFAHVRHVLSDATPACVLVDECWRGRMVTYFRTQLDADVVVSSISALAKDDSEPWVAPDIGPDVLALLQYPWAAMNPPKGVMVDHRNLLDNSALMQARWGSHEHSVHGSWLPLHHAMGLVGVVVQVLYEGSTGVLLSPRAFAERPYLWLRLIGDYGVDIAGAPNGGYEHCIERVSDHQLAGVDLSGWRVAINAAEPVREETLRRFSARFSRNGFSSQAHMPCYGLIESTLCVCACDRPKAPNVLYVDGGDLIDRKTVTPDPCGTPLVACGSVRGDPASSLDVRIVDPDSRRALGVDRVGEIWISGSSVARGYLGSHEDTSATFRAQIRGRPGTYYLRTGDLGFIHAGELFVTGRRAVSTAFSGRADTPSSTFPVGPYAALELETRCPAPATQTSASHGG